MPRTTVIISALSLSIFVSSCNHLTPAPTLALELSDKPAENERYSEGIWDNGRKIKKQELLDKFRDSEECQRLVLRRDGKADFTLKIEGPSEDISGRNKGPGALWTVNLNPKVPRFDSTRYINEADDYYLGLPNICKAIWEEVDPNHYKRPGGRIE